MLITPHVMPAQQSTAPPSSLPTTPLAPGENVSGQLPSCDLCRTPEPRRGMTSIPTDFLETKPFISTRNPRGAPSESPQSQISAAAPHAQSILHTGTNLGAGQAQAIDGDTIRYGAERIRIRGLTAPELTEQGGQEALERLIQLLREGPIRIVPHGKDVYDRTVADVFVNGQNVVEILMADGYGRRG